MPDLSNNSFIPKRGPSKLKQKEVSRQVYIFTYISYILMFATLLATGGVFLYGQYVERQLDDEIAALNAEISGFSEADMARVTDFDERLKQASGRLDTSVSLVALMEAIELATIDTVQVISLNMDREFDEKYILNGVVQTDSFDSTIFQREIYERDEVISSVIISGVQTATLPATGGSDTQIQARPVVSFNAELEVPISAIPFEPNRTPTTQRPLTITAPVELPNTTQATGTTATETEDAQQPNQDGL